MLDLAKSLVGLIFLAAAASQSLAQDQTPITARSSQNALDELKTTYEVPDFRLGGTYDLRNRAAWSNGGEDGTTLESLGSGPLKTAYIAVGTPERNADGEIVNAIVISSYYSGDATDMYFNWVEGQGGNGFSGGALVGPGLLFDTNRFYVVFVDALGLWGASKPSDGLGLNFPQYSYHDMVQANYRLLRDELKVAKVRLATGVSMGATQSYLWGLMHPGFVEAVMPIGGATATDGDAPIAAWSFQLAKAFLQGDPVWQATGGDYYDLPLDQHPVKGPAAHWSMLSLTGFQLNHRQSLGWDAVSPSVFTWEPTEGVDGSAVEQLGIRFDAVDLMYRVGVGETHNINAYLPDYPTRTMVVHIENDQWLTFDKAKESVAAIPGAQLASVSSPISHYAVFSALNLLKDDPILDSFLRDIGIKPVPSRVCDAPGYRSPRVNMNPDPNTSFWLDNMVHPFEPKFADVTDERGQEWQIGYLDVACEGIEDQQTLVVIHGKGAFASHYGYLIKHAVEQGYRVIAPDMPHAGLSGPGNLGRPWTRTHDDMRSAFHQLIVEQLGVAQAYYLGHSLGGQNVLGYALKYPDAVKGLILEAPAGLEEFPQKVMFGDQELNVFDPAYAHDFSTWQKNWEPTGSLAAETARDEQGVRDFFYFKSRDPETGAISPSFFGYFKQDTEFARLHTDQRIAMISGNPEEFEQWLIWFIYDIYTIGSELVKGDPNNLYQRLTDIDVPIFLAFGTEEPFIPSTSLNGLENMATDVIIPFMQRAEAADMDVTLKLYPGVGHFIHTDVPYEFAADTVTFMKSGKVQTVSATVIDALVNGIVVGNDDGGSASRPEGFSK